MWGGVYPLCSPTTSLSVSHDISGENYFPADLNDTCFFFFLVVGSWRFYQLQLLKDRITSCCPEDQALTTCFFFCLIVCLFFVKRFSSKAPRCQRLQQDLFSLQVFCYGRRTALSGPVACIHVRLVRRRRCPRHRLIGQFPIFFFLRSDCENKFGTNNEKLNNETFSSCLPAQVSTHCKQERPPTCMS